MLEHEVAGMREMGVELHPRQRVRTRLANVCLRTSAALAASHPSSSSRSKATGRPRGRDCDALACQKLELHVRCSTPPRRRSGSCAPSVCSQPGQSAGSGMPSHARSWSAAGCRLQGITAGHQPIAIVLDLMHPARPGWRSLTRGWQAGFDNGRQRHFVTMP